MAASRLRPAAVWAAVLVAAGCVGAAAALMTSPVVESVNLTTLLVTERVRDLLSAPLLYLGVLGLVPLTAAAGWCVPRQSHWWGLLAAVPYWVMVVAWVVWTSVEIGGVGALLGIPITVMIVLTMLPWAAGLAGAALRRRRQERRVDRV